MLPSSGTADGGAWERPLRRGVCWREMDVHVCSLLRDTVCTLVSTEDENGRDSPTDTPRSSAVSTLTERSGFTLPMICTPFPGERWASWMGWSVSVSLAYAVGVSVLPACSAKRDYGEVMGVPSRGREGGGGGGGRFLTRFRCAVMFPSASMTASSPRSWTTLPTTMTCLPTYELR